MYFRMKFALFLHFFDSWFIIKYLLTETSGKQYVLLTVVDVRVYQHRQSRVHKTYCFPRSQSISVNYLMVVLMKEDVLTNALRVFREST